VGGDECGGYVVEFGVGVLGLGSEPVEGFIGGAVVHGHEVVSSAGFTFLHVT
jgi:hypothetical protein